MKRLIILLAAISSAIAMQSCVKTIDPSTSCAGFIADGTLRELPSSCFGTTVTAANNFSIHIDSLKLPAGKTLDIIAKASSVDETSGWKFSFTGGTSGKVRVSRLGSAQAMDSATYDTTDGQTWCIDIHGDENPNHTVFWKNKCSTVFANGVWGNADFNSNDQAASAGNYAARASTNYGTGMVACAPGQCFQAAGDPVGTKILYKADNSTTTSITIETPRSSGL
jgi:hypothetical protein